jgi:drug/metabolite transporter (DMT)-like permease
VLGEAVIERQMPSRNKIFAIILALVGLVVILYEKGMTYSLYGVVLCFLSSVTYAIYCLGLSEKNTRKMPSLTVTAYVTTLSAVYNLVECLQSGTGLVITDGASLGLLTLLAIGGTVIPAITFFSGLKIVGSGAATIISTVEPAFVYILEVLILGQAVIFKNVFGGLIIAAAVILLNEKTPILEIESQQN